MEDAIIVNLFGGPGVGKSTTAAGVFALLKLHGVECELVTEFAKDLVWEERHKTFGDQHYIFGKQHHRLWRVKDKVDIVVTDCPLLLSPLYGERYQTVLPSFENNVVDIINTYNNKNIILTRTKKYNNNGRNENEDQAKEVDEMVRKYLSTHDMGWVEVPGNFEGINMIVNLLLDENPKFKIGV